MSNFNTAFNTFEQSHHHGHFRGGGGGGGVNVLHKNCSRFCIVNRKLNITQLVVIYSYGNVCRCNLIHTIIFFFHTGYCAELVLPTYSCDGDVCRALLTSKLVLHHTPVHTLILLTNACNTYNRYTRLSN